MAVYTQLTEEDVKGFLAHYDIGALRSFEGIVEGIDNTNFLVVADARYILTVFESRIRAEELPYFLGYSGWLAERGIPCPKPMQGRDGEVIRTLKGKPAALVQFLEGKGNPDITPAHTALVGDLDAKMHLAAQDFLPWRENNLSLAGWRIIFDKIAPRADEVFPGMEKLIRHELAFLEEHWPGGLPSGPVHADLFPDNVFFTYNAGVPALSGVIDFYFACNDSFAYDLMICLNAWCFDDRQRFVPELASALLKSYRDVRPLEDAELRALPLLARAAALRFLVTRAHDWIFRVPGALVNPKNPMDYVMRLKFFQQDDTLATL